MGFLDNFEKAKKEKRAEARSKFFDPTRNETIRIVAEGDSWYDYPVIKDIVDFLIDWDYCVIKESEAGDTLENIVYGNSYSIDDRTGTAIHYGKPNLNYTIKAVEEYNPQIVLFSAGGNDILGPELAQYLNHAASDPDTFLRKEVFDRTVKGPIREAITCFIERVIAVNPNVDILMDGYDYPFPTGKKFRLFGLGLSGPWLLPAFARKGITNFNEQRVVIRQIVDKFNELLAELQQEYDQFHHLDLRGTFPQKADWRDELHLTSDGFEIAARIYDQKIKGLLNKRLAQAG
ncbi:MAG TPA: hypothetical protein DCE41_30590 [Cytophagales bacterium]|nr:hypothetical protein [Cytophagales bacterium]HAA19466.1 hypothetical protein [Cytophagales bacterium]HAP61922.1 hypothetical protein [Cytophagales bacterium]